jgi:hypothetical protein
LKVSRNTIKKIISGKSNDVSPRKDKIIIDPDILLIVYKRCDGWVQRVQEVLQDEYKIEISYSTLTRIIREMGFKEEKNQRCDFRETKPGSETQHDTSMYQIKIASNLTRVVASLLYYRYSKQRYLKFYPQFRRFEMKCFFYEAKMFFKYTAPICVIDNTNLAVLRGTGKNAVFVPEMIALAKDFGFEWLAHEKMHSNRKAGEERSFWTVETNFFPGREFSSWEDLNLQALKWSTEIMANKVQTKDKIIPNIWFENEKKILKSIPEFVREPSLVHDRGVDQYGYAALNANFYWVPGKDRDDVKLIEYGNRVEIYRSREKLAEYQFPPIGTKNKRIPDKIKDDVRRKDEKTKWALDEAKIRTEVPEVSVFLDKALHVYPGAYAKSQFLKHLTSLHRKLSKPMFIEAVHRAEKYGVTDVKVIERISIQLLRNSLLDLPLPEVSLEFVDSEVYQEGRQSPVPDFSLYKNETQLKEDEDGNG